MNQWSNDLTDNLKQENFTSSNYHIGGKSYIPFLAFDNHTASTTGDGFQISNPSKLEWLKIDFINPVNPSKLTIQGNDQSYLPKNIKILMSADDLNYIEIDTIANITNDNKINEYVYKKPNNKYRFLKIEFLELYSTEWLAINQMQFFTANAFYLLKQNEQYFSIRPEFYKNNKYTPLDLFGGDKPNKNDFEEFGFDNLVECKTIISDISVNSKDMGILNSGKYFELELPSSFKNIMIQPNIEEIDAIDRITDKNFMKWYGSTGQTISINLKPDFYSSFYYVKHPDGGRDTIISDGTFFYTDGTNSPILNKNKCCNKINFWSGSYTAITGVSLKRIEPIFYFIQYNSQLYTFNGTEILLAINQTLNDENFINNGITDLTTISKEIWDNKFPLKTGLKILAFTNMNKTDIELSCAITQYKPIDKFNKFQIMIKR